MFKQSISLITITLVILSAAATNASEVEVKAGNVQVSVENGQVQVDNGSTKINSSSLLERLTGLRLFGGGSSRSQTETNLKCDGVSSVTSSRHASDRGVSKSSSSSTTMTCK